MAKKRNSATKANKLIDSVVRLPEKENQAIASYFKLNLEHPHAEEVVQLQCMEKILERNLCFNQQIS